MLMYEESLAKYLKDRLETKFIFIVIDYIIWSF